MTGRAQAPGPTGRAQASGAAGRAALVTGCSSGIGHATVLRLHAAGLDVYATAWRPGSLADLAAAGIRTCRLIAQANFPDELRHQNSGPAPFRYFLPGGRSHRAQVVPDHLVSEPEKLTVGGVEFVFIPITGGETHDGLIIGVPDRQVVFTGDMSMPYLGAPFFAEGSAEGLFEAMETVMALRPRLLIHGHAGLTDAYTIEAFPGLLAAFRDLDDAVRAGITDGLTLVEILQLNHLPEVLKDHPSAVIPYLVTRDHFIQRVHRQRTGYWHPAGEGVEHFTPAELAAAADLLGGGTTAAFHTAGAELTRRGEHALALRILDLGLLSHPGTPELLDLRQRTWRGGRTTARSVKEVLKDLRVLARPPWVRRAQARRTMSQVRMRPSVSTPWPPPAPGSSAWPGASCQRAGCFAWSGRFPVNPGVEFGINPDSHLWADAPDGRGAAPWTA
jgi:NAD(P)-dependent dehydrogenase (short-subunit alcohol dehydrogenase family)